ncbi:hypothetical protein FDENT_814 [Fusarium denticulatum]|uniref:Ankyrin n=1 Tax=Fusarium denticulatum TaxID=48507 RepID=A0A8H5XJK1_9HYPO|nr:hypothetical protein FDENT_814 [Fusarium denticulatum]
MSDMHCSPGMSKNFCNAYASRQISNPALQCTEDNFVTGRKLQSSCRQSQTKLTFDNGTDDSARSLCVKGGFDPDFRESLPFLYAIHRREAEFYYCLATKLRIPLPPVLYAGTDTVNGQGIVVMADLKAQGYTFGNALQTWTVGRARMNDGDIQSSFGIGIQNEESLAFLTGSIICIIITCIIPLAQTLHASSPIFALSSLSHPSTAAMRSLLFLALCGIPLALAQGCCGDCCRGPRFRPDIRADTNRDGRVDLEVFSEDKIDKMQWNETHGAIFLPNIGDTVKRCLSEFLKPKNISDERLDDCRDVSDDTLRSPEYLTNLKTVPEPDLFGSATGTVTVADAVQRKFVRIFQKKGKDWVYIDNHHTFHLPELQAGLNLGIDARDTRRPESWDGNVTVCFTIKVEVSFNHGINNFAALHQWSSKDPCKAMKVLKSEGELDLQPISHLLRLSMIPVKPSDPFSAAIHNGHSKLALALLGFLPAEAKYFLSEGSLMQNVAVLGSLELLTALQDKGVAALDVSDTESTPMHHLSATCTPEFAQYLAGLYDPFCPDHTTKFPFQLFFERWLRHNTPVKFDETIPLDPEMLKILIPKDNEFPSPDKVTHAWQFVCAALAVDQTAAKSIPLSPWNVTIISPEIWQRSSIMVCFPRMKAQGIHLVVDPSKISIPLRDVDDSYHFFKLALSRASPELIGKLIDLGVDVHRRVPEDISSSPTSLFEMACGEASIETFKAIVETVSSRSINDVGLSGQSPLELVVKGSSPDKISLIKALDDRGLVPSATTPATPLIIEAAKQNDLSLIKCLSDIGHDPFTVDLHGWGISQWAATNRELDILKWIVERSSSPSQWQLAPASTWTSTNETKIQIVDDEVSLLHFVADRPDFLSYFFENRFFDINISTLHGRTVLHYAAMRGSMACCLMLLRPRDWFHELASFLLASGSPLPRGQVAATGEMIKDLTSNEGLQLARRGEFEAAIMNGNLEQCKVAASKGCLIKQPLPSCHSCTPIFAAIRAQKPVIVNWLLDEGSITYSFFCKRHPTQNLLTHAVTAMEPSAYIEKLLSTALRSRSITRAYLVDAICQNISKRNLNVLKLILSHFRENVNEYYNTWKGGLGSVFDDDSAEQFKSELISYYNPVVFPHRTPLQVAAVTGHVEMVKFLIQQGADVNLFDQHHDTALIIAASHNNVLAVSELLRHNAIIETSNKFGNTAMSLAVLMGHLDIVKLLAEERPSSLQYRNIDGSNLLLGTSQESSSLATFKYLLSKGLNSHQRSNDGMPMLAFPLLRGRYVDYLSQSRWLDGPLSHAAPSPDSILNNAIIFCTTSQIKRLYKSLPPRDAGILLNMKGRSQGSPLCLAVFRCNGATTRLLLDLGADVNKVGCWFGTPLMCAITFGNLELVKLLVRRGAGLEYADENGEMVSGLEKSIPFPNITRWLLVGRFHDQKMLEDKAFNGSHRRRWEESTLDYCKRLAELKRILRGSTAFVEFV